MTAGHFSHNTERPHRSCARTGLFSVKMECSPNQRKLMLNDARECPGLPRAPQRPVGALESRQVLEEEGPRPAPAAPACSTRLVVFLLPKRSFRPPRVLEISPLDLKHTFSHGNTSGSIDSSMKIWHFSSPHPLFPVSSPRNLNL